MLQSQEPSGAGGGRGSALAPLQKRSLLQTIGFCAMYGGASTHTSSDTCCHTPCIDTGCGCADLDDKSV